MEILAELLRFATYKNLSFVQRQDSDSETSEDDKDDNEGQDNGVEIEFIGKRAYNKDKTVPVSDANVKKLKTKNGSKKPKKTQSDKLEIAIKDMGHIYQLFDALDCLSPSDIDQYLDDTCKVKRFTGILHLKKIINPQVLLFEVIGLVRKKYHLIIEKQLLSYIPRDYFRQG